MTRRSRKTHSLLSIFTLLIGLSVFEYVEQGRVVWPSRLYYAARDIYGQMQSQQAPAAEAGMAGWVSKVADGDTFTLNAVGQAPRAVRLYGIDAPERDQAYGELYRWRNKAKGRLAEAIVLDQFSRNIHRNTPMAFSQDAMALALGQEAITAGSHQSLTATECSFLMLPYMHSKSRLVHAEAERLSREYAPPYNYEFELKHKAIVDRFGRYPHRNGILGRTSTAEEVEFLQQPESGF